MYADPGLFLVFIVYSALIGIVSSSLVMGFRLDGVVNLGLPGLMFVGALAVNFLVSGLGVNPYWGLVFGVVFGGLFNLVLGRGFLWFRRVYTSRVYSYLLSVLVYVLFHFGGWGLWGFLRARFVSFTVMGVNFVSRDFSLFGVSGVLLVSVAWLGFLVLFHLGLEPVFNEDGVARRWVDFVYFLAGASACSAGVLYRVWFLVGRWSFVLVLLVVGSAFFGGLRRAVPVVWGAFIVTGAMIFGVSFIQGRVGSWTGDYRFLVPVFFFLISLLFFPDGILGRLLSELNNEA